jgi:hypothetical protein
LNLQAGSNGYNAFQAAHRGIGAGANGSGWLSMNSGYNILARSNIGYSLWYGAVRARQIAGDAVAAGMRAYRNANNIQLHHLVTNGMVTALENIGFVGARALRDREALQYFSAPGMHVGQERWHLAMDKTMQTFIAANAEVLDESMLLRFIHNYYQNPELSRRIPGVNLLN